MTGYSVRFAARVVVLLRRSARPLLVVLVAVLGFQLLVGLGGGMGDVARGMASTLVGVLPLVFAGVCADLNQGVGSLWLQKPVSPVRLYLACLAESAVAAVALPLLLVAGTALALAIGGSGEAGDLVRSLPALALWVTVALSVGFGMSAWLPRGGHVATVCVIVIAVAVTLASVVATVGGGRRPRRRPSSSGFCRRSGCCSTLGTTPGERRRFPLAKPRGRWSIPPRGSALGPWASPAQQTEDWSEARGDQGACSTSCGSRWLGMRTALRHLARSVLAR